MGIVIDTMWHNTRLIASLKKHKFLDIIGNLVESFL